MSGTTQNVRRGTSFPGPEDEQNDGSLFIREDLPGMQVFQYRKRPGEEGVYVRIEAVEIDVQTSDEQ